MSVATQIKNTKQGSLWVNSKPVWTKGKPEHPTEIRAIARRGPVLNGVVHYRVHRERFDGVGWVMVRGSIAEASATIKVFLEEFTPLGIETF